MQHFKNWLIDALLKKDKLVAVPVSWQEDYVKMAGNQVKQKTAIAAVITEFNNLLKDYFEKCSVKDLQEELTGAEISFKSNMSKAELVELAYNEFKMTIEK